jgi:hypothetical protein
MLLLQTALISHSILEITSRMSFSDADQHRIAYCIFKSSVVKCYSMSRWSFAALRPHSWAFRKSACHSSVWRWKEMNQPQLRIFMSGRCCFLTKERASIENSGQVSNKRLSFGKSLAHWIRDNCKSFKALRYVLLACD